MVSIKTPRAAPYIDIMFTGNAAAVGPVAQATDQNRQAYSQARHGHHAHTHSVSHTQTRTACNANVQSGQASSTATATTHTGSHRHSQAQPRPPHAHTHSHSHAAVTACDDASANNNLRPRQGSGCWRSEAGTAPTARRVIASHSRQPAGRSRPRGKRPADSLRVCSTDGAARSLARRR